MKAAVLYGKGDIKYSDWPEPETLPGTVKLRVKACGICGSDVPRVLGDAAHYYPIVLGHEFSGIVEETGGGVTSMHPGDHAVGVPLLPCMECNDCRKGDYSLCKYYSFIGSRQQGAFADYVVLPEKNVVQVDKSIPFVQAATFEPSTVALHGVRLSDFSPGGTVAVLGCGIIGLYTMQWARRLGAKKVVAVGRGSAGVEAARKLGADAAVSVLNENCAEELYKATGGKGFNYVYESSGSTDAMKTAFKIAGNHAHICFIGTPKESLTLSVREWEQLNRKEFFLSGSWMSYSAPFPGTEWEETARRYASGEIRFIPEMVYKIMPMENAAEAFEMFKSTGQVKGRIILSNSRSEQPSPWLCVRDR